jgi:hypothetical protein
MLFLWTTFLLAGLPAFAQQDLTGEYQPMFHEDQPERIPVRPWETTWVCRFLYA